MNKITSKQSQCINTKSRQAKCSTQKQFYKFTSQTTNGLRFCNKNVRTTPTAVYEFYTNASGETPCCATHVYLVLKYIVKHVDLN